MVVVVLDPVGLAGLESAELHGIDRGGRRIEGIVELAVLLQHVGLGIDLQRCSRQFVLDCVGFIFRILVKEVDEPVLVYLNISLYYLFMCIGAGTDADLVSDIASDVVHGGRSGGYQ